eukprot:TRINITY_DN29446_c0_g1_i1.p1 TRINITY_DN29446_c0_g1~~TRINITY_DN29446_c0_g1_i1.p1  ORF type:complete len:141 (+),score=28.61 TRINITY_DN29446_c0_g1_i1:86-508(+)
MFRRLQRLRDESRATDVEGGTSPAVGDPDVVSRLTANRAETFQQSRDMSITCEFLPGMLRPLRSDGPWIRWNHLELPESDDDDELLLQPDDEFEWGASIEDVATTCPSAAESMDGSNSQSSRASSMLSDGSKEVRPRAMD